jgi:antirestriction protein ArdC
LRDQIFDLQRRYGSLAAYANKITRTERSESGEDVERKIPFLKGHTVFNVEQIDGLPDHYYAQPAPRFDPITRIEHAEFFFRATGADIRYGGGRAFYSPSQDFIRMPPFEAFRDAESHYSTLAHETVHWTRHPTRLDRDFGRKRFGDEGYAIEELVAELGAAFLCASLELTLEPREEHASYIQNWLTVLRNDKRAIFQAAAHAQRAADFLRQLQPTAGEGDERPIAPLLQRSRPFPPRRVQHSALASITTIFSGRRPRAACRLRTQNVFDPRARNTHDNVRSSIQST